MNYDKILKQIFLIHDKRGWDKLESNRINKILNNITKYINLYKYIINRYNDYNNIYNLNNKKDIKVLFRESLVRIIYNINKRPVCLCCNKPVHFNGKTKLNYYAKYCSNSCSNKATFNKESLLKQYKYNLEHYGVKTNFEINKCKEKRLNTINNKYGNNAFKLFSNKCKETCLKRYGVESPMQLDYIKDKQQQACKLKYGSIYYTQTKDYLNKSYNTRKQNNTFNTSKPEEQGYKLLYNKFGLCNVKRQYKSELYPFNCDFYIVSTNTYIEFNFFWTHGDHLYNKNSIDDINKLNRWKAKSKTHKMYINAINTWTISDIKKYNTAKQNNLNYLTFYTWAEFIKWYNTI